uniref:Pep_M12B_propep domain-containing protein n=1 Tax=Macrostomum lignano TaxID=282301 RepID=A0A1I8FNR3_9PLAT
CFNLGLAPTLTCARGSDGESQYCSVCDACRLRYTSSNVKEWLSRAGDLSRRRFVVGLVRRAHSRDLLRHLGSLLALRSQQGQHLTPGAGVSDAHTRCERRSTICGNAEPLEDQIITGKFGDEFEVGRLAARHRLHNGSYRSEDDPNVELLRSASRAYSSAVESVKVAVAAAATDADADSLRTRGSRRGRRLGSDSRRGSRCSQSSRRSCKTAAATQQKCATTSIQDRQQKLQPQQQQKQQQQQQQQDSQSKTRPFTAEAVLNSIVLTAAGDTAFSGASGHVDFIRQLPVHLSKYIVNLLDDKSAKQAAARPGRPQYPTRSGGSHKVRLTGEPLSDQRDPKGHLFKNECNFEAGYRGVSTRNVIMEERNVSIAGRTMCWCCLSEEDPQRVTHYSGGNLLAYSDNNRRIHFADPGATPAAGTQPLRGQRRPGPMPVCCAKPEASFCLASYDTSLRSLETLEDWKAVRTLKHKSAVSAVAINENTAVTGDAKGKAYSNAPSSNSCEPSRHQRMAGFESGMLSAAIGCRIMRGNSRSDQF